MINYNLGGEDDDRKERNKSGKMRVKMELDICTNRDLASRTHISIDELYFTFISIKMNKVDITNQFR